VRHVVRTGIVVAVLAVLASLSSCSRSDGAIDLRSDAFADGGIIPERFSCEGDSISPPLSWSDVPDDAVELALVMADFETSTGIFHHWVMLGIDADDRSLETGEVPDGAVLAQATSQNPVYIGPCPPTGERHEYLLTLFPLRQRLDLPSGTPTKDALDAIDGARLPGEGELRGTYGG
ncbi:MAG: YbhB/YbcL family Raf kinase inhibitor-like protein, partial [Actinomycetota bacterium]|nr:YbhB/YbcL family Raf kinase inhibitor-like protein [Actinomycetota bacterium]